jgi:hypothetical protein
MVVTDTDGLKSLYDMLRYTQNVSTCRKLLMEKYFGQHENAIWGKEGGKACGYCDNCHHGQDGVEVVDITKQVATIINILSNASSQKERVTLVKLLDTWRSTVRRSSKQQSSVQAGDIGAPFTKGFPKEVRSGNLGAIDF